MKKNSLKEQLSQPFFLLAILGLIVAVAGPGFWVRLIGYAVAVLGMAAWALRGPQRLRTVLLVAFVTAYTVSPYWRLPLPGEQALPPWLIGVGWAALALMLAIYHRPVFGNKPLYSMDWKEIGGWFSLLAVWCLLQANAMSIDIPWRGDEAYHISNTRWILILTQKIAKRALTPEFVKSWSVMLLGGMLVLKLFHWLGLLSAYLPRMDVRATRILDFIARYGWLFAAVLLWASVGYDLFPQWTPRLQRYPFIGAWFVALPAWDKGVSVLIEPWWLRIGPMLGYWASGGVVFSWTYRRCADWPFALACGTVFLTLPTIMYYGATYYLEAIPLPLEMAVLMAPAFLLEKNTTSLRKSSRNTALCLFALVKETSAPMLALTGLLRLGVLFRRFLRERTTLPTAIRDEGIYLFCLAMVVAPYFLYRLSSGARGYNPTLSNLLNLTEYKIFICSLWEQTGLLAPMALVGAIWLIIEKEWSRVIVCTGVIVMYALFFLLDSSSYLGLARFNLLLLPGLVSLALAILVRLHRTNRVGVLAVLVVLVCVNWYLSPLNWWSGVSRPAWGHMRPSADCETYYPFRDAVRWLEQNQRDRPVLVYQHDYHFLGLRWASDLAGLRNVFWAKGRRSLVSSIEQEPDVLSELLHAAAGKKVPLVVYPCLNSPHPPELVDTDMAGYKLVALPANPFRALAIYEKQ